MSKRVKRSMDSLATAASSPAAAGATSSAVVPKKRVVKRAADADKVLAKCRQLRDALRQKQSESALSGGSSDDEWGIESDSDDGKGAEKGAAKAEAAPKGKAKTQQLSLAELKKKAIETEGKAYLEVAEMNSTEVMEGIENVAMGIARQVLAKQGFQLDIPCEHLIVCSA